MKPRFLNFLAQAVAATFALCVLAMILNAILPQEAKATDARVITEGGTNILAIGIDSRDFDVIRFYMRGNAVVELRADDIIHMDRKVLGSAISPAKLAERDAILAALAAQTNFGAGAVQNTISNLVRLKVLESIDDAGKPRPR